MRVAVVGHVEWIDFLVVERVPEPGEIVQAKEIVGRGRGGRRSRGRAARAGRGRRDALHRARRGRVRRALRGAAPPSSVCGSRSTGARSEQRRGFCYLDADGERTISLLSEKLRPRRAAPLPWGELAGYDAVYFTGGDPAALQAARAARVLVATARELPTVREAGVELDALVGSAIDPSERYEEGDLDPPPKLVVATEGSNGGRLEPGGRALGRAVPLPGAAGGHLRRGGHVRRVPHARPRRGARRGHGRRDPAAAAAITRRGAHGSAMRPRRPPDAASSPRSRRSPHRRTRTRRRAR